MTIKFLQAVTIEVPLDPASGGTGIDNGAFTLTLGGNTAISNGGTIALGGFTVTILESATAVLNSNTATAGHVGFFSNTYKLADDANFFWDNTNKRLGVGNAAPAEKLHVTGVGRFSAGLHLDYMDAQAIPYMSASTDRLVGNGSVFYYDDTNDVIHVGGSSTITGVPRLAIKGTASDATAGPHIAAYTSSDIYPLFQVLSYAHDNVNISFDAYFDGSWRSSDVGSNYRISKGGDSFGLYYNGGTAAGSAISTWRNPMLINNAGSLIETVTSALTTSAGTVILTRHNSTGTPGVNFGSQMIASLDSSTTANQNASSIHTYWTTATHASRQARVDFIAFDTAGRTCMSIEAGGGVAQFAVLGAAPITRQTGGAKTADLTYDATERDMLNIAYTALRNFGFLT